MLSDIGSTAKRIEIPKTKAAASAGSAAPDCHGGGFPTASGASSSTTRSA